MKRHHDNFRNDLFPEVENPEGTDDKSVYTNLFNIYVDLIFNSIFVKKIERTINAKFEDFEDTVRDEKKENEEIYSKIILEHSVKLKFIKIYLDKYLKELNPIEQAKVRDIYIYELAEAGAGSADAGAGSAEAGASIIEKIYTFLSDNNYIYTYIFKQLIDNTKSLLENSFIEENMSLIKSIDDINQNNIITTKVLQLVKTFNKIFYKLDSYYSPLNKITEFIISKLDDCKKYETLSQQSSFNTKFVNTLNIQIPYNKYELTELKKILENKSIKTLKIYSYEWENFEDTNNLFVNIENLFYNWSLHNQKILDGPLYPNLINLNYSPNIYKYEQLDFSKLKKLSTLTINLSLFNNSSVDIKYKPEHEPEPGHILQELTINNIYIKELSVTCKNLILNNCNSDIIISDCNITKLTILNCAIEKKLDGAIEKNLDGAIEKKLDGGKTIIHDFLGTIESLGKIESLKLDNCFIEDEFESLDFTNLKNLELINVTNYKNRLVNPHILYLNKKDFKKLESLTIHGSNITCDLSSLFNKFFDTRYNPEQELDNFLTVNLEITDLYDIDGILSQIRTKVVKIREEKLAKEQEKEKEQAKVGYVEPPYQNIIFNIMGKSPKADILYKHFNSDGLKIICNKEDGTRESVV